MKINYTFTWGVQTQNFGFRFWCEYYQQRHPASHFGLISGLPWFDGFNLLQNLFLLSSSKNRSKADSLTSEYSFVFCHAMCSILCQWQQLWFIFSYSTSVQVFHSLSTVEAEKHNFKALGIICLVLWLEITVCFMVFTLAFYYSVASNCSLVTWTHLGLNVLMLLQKPRLDLSWCLFGPSVQAGRSQWGLYRTKHSKTELIKLVSCSQQLLSFLEEGGEQNSAVPLA